MAMGGARGGTREAGVGRVIPSGERNPVARRAQSVG
jgi:hypothetical protein